MDPPSKEGGYAEPDKLSGSFRRVRRNSMTDAGAAEEVPPAVPLASSVSDILPAGYQVRGEIGDNLYRVLDLENNREIAVQFCPQGAQERAQRLMSLSHPNVLECYGTLSHRGRDYLLLELAASGTLQGYIVANHGVRAGVLENFASVARALDALVQQGLGYPTFLPRQILLNDQGEPKLSEVASGPVDMRGFAQSLAQAVTPDAVPGDLLGLEDATPQAAAEVLEAYASRMRSTVATGRPVGRDAVIQRLEDHFLRLFQGQGASAIFTAPNGQGRSTVAREVVQRLRAKGLVILEVVAHYNAPFPIRDAYRSLGGKPQEMDRRLRLGGALAAAQLLRERIGQSAKPVLLVADDLYRMGPTTNQVLMALSSLEPPPGHGWLISCGVARAATFALWQGCERIELPSLDPSLMRILAETDLDSPIDDALADWLTTRATGSVRRLRQLLLSLQACGCLRLQDGRYGLADGVPWPTASLEPVLAQLSAMPDDVKLLRAAALLGEPFHVLLAGEAAGLSDEETEACTARLLGLGVLEECWDPPSEFLQFSWSELRDSLNAGKADRGRRRLLGKLIQTLARQADSATLGRMEMLNDHPVEALLHLVKAAAEAQAAGCFAEALEFWNQTLQIRHGQNTDVMHWRILAGLGECLVQTGAREEALQRLEPALREARPDDNAELQRLRLTVAAIVARLQWEARLPLAELLSFCEARHNQALLRNDPPPQAGWLPVVRARCLEQLGDSAGALQVLSACTRVEDMPTAYWIDYARHLRATGRLEEACTVLRGRLEASQDLPIPQRLELHAEAGYSQCLVPGQLEAAYSVFDQGIALARACLNKDWEIRLTLQAARGREFLGQMKRARELLQKVVELARNTGRPVLAASMLARAQHHLQREELAEAEPLLRDALKNVPADESSLSICLSLAYHALLGTRQDQALQWIGQAERVAGASDRGAWLLPAARLMRAELERRRGSSEEMNHILQSLELPPGSFESWLSQSMRGLSGEGELLEAAARHLPQAQSYLPEDPLRPLRGATVQLLRDAQSAAVRTKQMPKFSLMDSAKLQERMQQEAKETRPPVPPPEPEPAPPVAEPAPAAPPSYPPDPFEQATPTVVMKTPTPIRQAPIPPPPPAAPAEEPVIFHEDLPDDPPPARRNPLQLALIALGLLILIGCGVAYFFTASAETPPAAPETTLPPPPPAATETASPSPAATASPDASVSPTDSASPEASVSPTDSASPEASVSPTDSVSPEASASPTDSASPEASASPSDSASPEASASPTDSAIPEASASPSEATASPDASASPETPAAPPTP